MKRRIVIIGGFAALLLTPERTPAQQPPAKIPRIGILTQASSDKIPIFDAFREGLRDLGYVEGRNIILEFRFAHGDPSRGPQLASELAALPVVGCPVAANGRHEPQLLLLDHTSQRKSGNRIRATAQLVEAETGKHVWAEMN